MSSASWVPTLITSAVTGGIGVVGVLTGSWLTARRDDRRQVREIERDRDLWNREDEQRWMEQRRTLYAQYLNAVLPWMRHTRHWATPSFPDEPEPTKKSLRESEGAFDWKRISDEITDLDTELTLIGAEEVRATASWLHAQLLAFEATILGDDPNLKAITSMGKHCEAAYDRLIWAFRTDLAVPSEEPPGKRPGLRKPTEIAPTRTSSAVDQAPASSP